MKAPPGAFCFSATLERTPKLLSHLLFYRLLILNLIGVVAFVAAWQKGWVSAVLDGDSTGMVYGIAGLFIVGMVSLLIRAAKVTAGLNALKRLELRSTNSTKFLEKAAHLEDIPNWLTVLGLLGTVIGIMIALSGIDLNSLATPEGTKKALAVLMEGMRVAFCTTIAGGVLGLWFDFNRRILKTATVLMLEDMKQARGR